MLLKRWMMHQSRLIGGASTASETITATSLLDILGPVKTTSSSPLLLTNDICELYQGAFFNPTAGLSRKPRSRIFGDEFLSGTDTEEQFNRFERSIFKLDNMLNNRKANKFNSLPFLADSLVKDAGHTEPSAHLRNVNDVGNWLESVGHLDKHATRKEAMRILSITDVLKKTMYITADAAESIEEEFRREDITMTVCKDKPEMEISRSHRMLRLDYISIRLLSGAQIKFLFAAYDIELPTRATRSSLDRQLTRWYIEAIKKSPEEESWLRSLKKESNADRPLVETTEDWSNEDDRELIKVVEFINRRKKQVNGEFTNWLLDYNLSFESVSDCKDLNANIWTLVMSKFPGRTATGCRNRWLRLQQSLLRRT